VASYSSVRRQQYLQRLIDIVKTSNEEYIFNYTYRGRIITLNVIKKFEKYEKQARITNKQTSPHQYRRTFDVKCVKAGMDVFTLHKMLGHASISTTCIHVNLDNSNLINSHSKINVISKFI
jgi:integrase/recombinase XerD